MSDVIDKSVIDEIVYSAVVQTDGQQVNYKAFRYKVIMDENNNVFVTVMATSATLAHDGLKQQFPNKVFSYDGVSTMIIQCNGQIIV